MTDLSAPPLVPPDRANLAALLFGMMGGPFFWIAQLVASYTASDLVCYRADHPAFAPSVRTVGTALLVFDVVAILGAFAALIVSVMSWRTFAHRTGVPNEPKDSRSLFMAIWGTFSSVWFLGAIAFGCVGTALVPICLR